MNHRKSSRGYLLVDYLQGLFAGRSSESQVPLFFRCFFVPHATVPTQMRLTPSLAAISSFVLLPSRLAAISLAVRPCFPDWRQCRSVLASAFPPGGSRFFNALTSRSAVSASCVFALPDWRQTHSRPPAWRPLIPAADESARSAAVAVSLSLQISRTKL